jgi:ABC-2 type transport system ATP-binding protein
MGADTIIRTTELTKQYGEITAVNHLNLEIKRGEVFGLLGPNGAGKTTTTLMLLGLTDPTSGKAEINGFDCTRESISVKKIVGYLPDNVGFYPDMTGRQNLVFSGMMNGLSEKESRSRAEKLLDRVSMTYAADRRAGTYSRGMRQRLGIADVLMKDPEIIIMDEPTLGIDPVGMHELTALIRDLSLKDGRTILISSHEMYQIQAISDRVGIFVRGSLIACGKINELGAQLKNEGLYMIDIRVDNPDDRLSGLIRSIENVRSVGKPTGGGFHIESGCDIRKDLLKMLVDNGYGLSEMHERGGDLDEIYRKYFEMAGENNDNRTTADNTKEGESFTGKFKSVFGKKEK